MKISIQSFKGVAPRVNARYLDQGAAQVALNVEAFGQSLKPLRGPSPALATLSTGDLRTLYRFGQDYPGEDKYWFHCEPVADYCRFQVAGDTKEWTCFAGAGYPKLTNSDLATQGEGTAYPLRHLRLGLPAPADTVALKATVVDPPQNQDPAEVALTATHLTQMTSAYGVKVSTSTDDGETWTTNTAALSGGAPSVTLNAAQVAQVTSDYGVYVSLDNGATKVHCPVTPQTGGTAATVVIQLPDPLYNLASATMGAYFTVNGTYRGVTYFRPDETTLAFAINAKFGELVTAVDGTSPSTATVSTLATGAEAQLAITVVWVSPPAFEVELFYETAQGGGGSITASAVAKAINTYAASLVTATAANGAVTVVADTGGASIVLWVRWGAAANQVLTATGTGFTPAQVAAAINALANANAVVDGTGVRVTSADEGSTVALKVQWGDQSGRTLTAKGFSQDLGLKETRVYTFTYLFKDGNEIPEGEDGHRPTTLTIESQPWAPEDMSAATVEVYTGTGGDRCWLNGQYGAGYTEASCEAAGGTWEGARSLVTLSGFAYPPAEEDWTITGIRVYRAVAGVYLFVDEVPAADLLGNDFTFVDRKLAAELGEPCPSVTWSAPPPELKGLINLPNGLTAGFAGRDVYFSPPYRPYTYPQEYVQTLDYPIVGLGRLDTTLVVLTKGTPYLIQGTAPEYMRVVKSDLEQACVSKRSIVSMEGAVLYASPDGLVLLTAGGAKVISEALFRREDWQRLNPHSLHAYGHDGKYIAFHDKATINDVDYHGFILDLKSQQFVQHNISDITAGYSDLRFDQLYLIRQVAGANQVVKWAAGANLLGRWRSKLFTMPQIQGFAGAQVEAERYGGSYLSSDSGAYLLEGDLTYDVVGSISVKFWLYRADPGELTEHRCGLVDNQVASRGPFRLEAKHGRDWVIELETSAEVFNVCMAQSMTELAEA